MDCLLGKCLYYFYFTTFFCHEFLHLFILACKAAAQFTVPYKSFMMYIFYK